MEISIGRVVRYKLTARDAEQINRRRTNGSSIAERMARNETTVTHWPIGAQAHIGTFVEEGMELPMMVVVTFDENVCNGQVFLDGNDTLWITSVHEGEENGQWHWPTRTITGETEVEDLETTPTKKRQKGANKHA